MLRLPAHVLVDYLSGFCSHLGKVPTIVLTLLARKDNMFLGLKGENTNIVGTSQNTNISHWDEHKKPAGKTLLFTDLISPEFISAFEVKVIFLNHWHLKNMILTFWRDIKSFLNLLKHLGDFPRKMYNHTYWNIVSRGPLWGDPSVPHKILLI